MPSPSKSSSYNLLLATTTTLVSLCVGCAQASKGGKANQSSATTPSSASVAAAPAGTTSQSNVSTESPSQSNANANAENPLSRSLVYLSKIRLETTILVDPGEQTASHGAANFPLLLMNQGVYREAQPEAPASHSETTNPNATQETITVRSDELPTARPRVLQRSDSNRMCQIIIDDMRNDRGESEDIDLNGLVSRGKLLPGMEISFNRPEDHIIDVSTPSQSNPSLQVEEYILPGEIHLTNNHTLFVSLICGTYSQTGELLHSDPDFTTGDIQSLSGGAFRVTSVTTEEEVQRRVDAENRTSINASTTTEVAQSAATTTTTESTTGSSTSTPTTTSTSASGAPTTEPAQTTTQPSTPASPSDSSDSSDQDSSNSDERSE